MPQEHLPPREPRSSRECCTTSGFRAVAPRARARLTAVPHAAVPDTPTRDVPNPGIQFPRPRVPRGLVPRARAPDVLVLREPIPREPILREVIRLERGRLGHGRRGHGRLRRRVRREAARAAGSSCRRTGPGELSPPGGRARPGGRAHPGNPSLLRDAPLLGRPPGAVVAAGGSARRARTRRPVETVRPRWHAPTVRQPVLSAGPAVRRAGSRAARRRSVGPAAVGSAVRR